MPGPRSTCRLIVALALVLAAVGPLTPAAADAGDGSTAPAWADVSPKHWARVAIDFVAHEHNWMNDYGSTHFRPNGLETRKYLAHAMVMAFAPDEPIDPTITFGDMATTDPFYRFANVSVKLQWLARVDGNFLPDQPVTMTDVHVAMVHAVGLWDVAEGVDGFHTTDGYVFQHGKNLGGILIGMLLELRYNHSDESLDVHPGDALRRSEVAWSLYQGYRSTTDEQWKLDSIRSDGYGNLHVGPISEDMRKVVEFGLQYVGYPYIYAAEWASPTPPGYCCGAQAAGGFDCSGLTWWLMKAPSGSYDNTDVRGYRGWSLPQRSSADMASVGRAIPFEETRPGDLMFYSSAGPDGAINHVDTYLGYGWALDSSNGVGGVTVMHVKDGWYRDHFVHARRIVKQAAPSKT
jgi:hypothetical protein